MNVFNDLKSNNTLLRILLILGIITLSIYLFNIAWQFIGNFSDLILIFVASWILSFVLEPLADSTTRTIKLPKPFATLLVYILVTIIFASIVFLLIPQVTYQTQILLGILPSYLEHAPPFITKWGETVTTLLDNSVTFLPSIAQFFFSFFVVLIFSFYFIVDKERITGEFYSLTPKKLHGELHFLEQTLSSVFGSFLRVQVLYGVITGVLTWLVMTLLGIDFAASTSFLAGLLGIIPLIGPLLSVIPPVFITLLSNPIKAVLFAIIMLVIQQFIYNVVGPKLLSSTFKVHPIVIIASFFVGTKIAGPTGALFAVPILGVLSLVIRRLWKHFLAKG